MQGLSPAQLLWVFADARRRRSERDLRTLLITAAGAQGGKPFELMLRDLKRELSQESREAKPEEPVSQMPLSMDEFEAMVREDQD